MSHIAFPRLDQTILARRDAIVERPGRAPCRAECLIADESGRRAFETDALTAYRRLPLAVVLPRTTEEVARVLKLCRDEKVNVVPRGAGTSLSGGAIPQEDAVVIALTKMSRILEVNLADRYARVEAGVTNLAISEAVAAGGLLLRARPFLAARLHHRRQYRHELGRRALPQIRRHHQQPPRRPARHARRRDPRYRRRGDGRARLRSPRPRLRLRGPARDRHRGDGAHHSAAGRGAAGAVRLRFGRGREPLRRRDHRRRHRSGGDGIHGQAGDRDLREFRPRRLSARRRSDADHRGRGLGRRDRRDARPGSARSPRRTTCARCASRCRRWKAPRSGRAANRRSARPAGSPTISAWTARCRPAGCRRRCSAPARSAPRSGFGSPMSSTPATATCIRWSSTTSTTKTSGPKPRRRARRFSRCASSSAAA